MIYIETESKDAAFHFSVEEYIVRHFPWDEPVMMIWQAGKCAMLGSNQIAEAEIDIGYAEREGIQIVRRSSGGGTIFTDLGTFLYTMILPHTEHNSPEAVRKIVAGPIVEALNEMGCPAKIEGRNDIHVEGVKKIGGMAQYSWHGRICTHGSLLYDEDLEKLTRALRADDEKIRSKALRSMRSRVTNIKEYIPHDYSTHEFLGILKQKLFCGEHIREHSLTDDEIAQINRIYQDRYGNPAWTFGRAPKFSLHNSKRFTGGRIEVYFEIVKGIVNSCSIRGDFLGIVPIQGLEEVFQDRPFRAQAFEEALANISIQPYLGSITKEEFLSCIFD